MKCPKCRSTDLMPTRLEHGLPVMGCDDCGGSLLGLLYYRDWAERLDPEELDGDLPALVEMDDDTTTAMACPKCARMMTKFSIASEHRNRIDLCGSCDEAWLDDSEWNLLKSLELAHKLPRVFTDQWQRRVRDEKMQALREERLRRVVGEDDAARAVAIRSWLQDNRHKATIVQFIGSD